MKVELKKGRKLRIGNTVRFYQQGEIVDLRANTANNFIKLGYAKPASLEAVLSPLYNLPVVQTPHFVFEQQVIWDGKTSLKPARIEKGLALLKVWEMAVPLYDTLLAARIGEEADRKRTQDMIGELRIPTYEPGAVFIRKTEATIEFLLRWREEQQFGDNRLAFLRALYATPLLILPLPSNWLDL